jgi:hypothetical protein
MRRLAAVWACASLIAAVGVTADAADAPIATLGVGDEAFWEGTARPADGNGTRVYLVQVTEAGARLRIALDRRSYSPSLEVRSPSGVAQPVMGGWYGIETFVTNPAVGTWKITSRGAIDPAPFRFRARLDGAAPPKPSPPVTLLPNLRMVPPFEFTFRDPGVFGASVGGPGCSVQEIVETNARRCLRFSLGPANTGAGPLLVRFAPLEGLVTSGTAYQAVFDSDGNSVERPAGTFEYHKTHMHYHHSGFGRLELLRVLDEETGEMAPAGEGPKQGFCTGDVVMFDWFGFTQPREPVDSACVDEAASSGTNRPMGTTMALNTGWADLYSWSQDGMYVEWGGNGDGTYVVRANADSRDWILESDEGDNASYALIRIEGETIDVVERGLGTDPWDPGKIIVDDRYDLTI